MRGGLCGGVELDGGEVGDEVLGGDHGPVTGVPDGHGEPVGAALGVVLPEVGQREVLHRVLALAVRLLPHAARRALEAFLPSKAETRIIL